MSNAQTILFDIFVDDTEWNYCECKKGKKCICRLNFLESMAFQKTWNILKQNVTTIIQSLVELEDYFNNFTIKTLSVDENYQIIHLECIGPPYYTLGRHNLDLWKNWVIFQSLLKYNRRILYVSGKKYMYLGICVNIKDNNSTI